MTDNQTTNNTSVINKIVIVSYCLAMSIFSATFWYVVDHNMIAFSSLVIVSFSMLLTAVLALRALLEIHG
ncbi:hypothetical protein A4R89_14810 (plasmid) [Acetobacter ascendens]|nr:hypothetical protein A4R89_14810 [Acetobacter ascendens]